MTVADELCSVYASYVSIFFDPTISLTSNPVATLNFKCFSSWYFPNEITTAIEAFASSTVYISNIPEHSVNGYYGIETFNNFVAAPPQTTPWIEYDFGKVVQIQKVIVKTRISIFGLSPQFKNVEVKVGNTSSPSGNFSSSTLLAQYWNTAVAGEVVVFEGSSPIWGRYVSIQSAEDAFFILANVNILGEE